MTDFDGFGDAIAPDVETSSRVPQPNLLCTTCRGIWYSAGAEFWVGRECPTDGCPGTMVPRDRA